MVCFSGKSIWITGASAGLGRELALAFAREGAHITLSARRKERLEEVAREVDAAGGRGFVSMLDVTSETATAQVVDDIVKREGGIDVAIANAGFGVVGDFQTLDAAAWRRQFEVNVIGLTITARAAIPYLLKRRGRLALIGSVAGMIPGPSTAPYSASKAAVLSIARSLAIELNGSGASCTGIYPGFIESEIGRVDNSGTFHKDATDQRPAKLLWPAERAAKVMLNAIVARRREFVFTAHGRLAGFMGRHCPGLLHAIMCRMKH